jgi:hypothetical protein
MTRHEFLTYLWAAERQTGGPLHLECVRADLKLNTPAGQRTGWERELDPLLPWCAKRGWTSISRCTECGRKCIAVTSLGKSQLELWNELGCGTNSDFPKRKSRKLGRCKRRFIVTIEKHVVVER